MKKYNNNTKSIAPTVTIFNAESVIRSAATRICTYGYWLKLLIPKQNVLFCTGGAGSGDSSQAKRTLELIYCNSDLFVRYQNYEKIKKRLLMTHLRMENFNLKKNHQNRISIWPFYDIAPFFSLVRIVNSGRCDQVMNSTVFRAITHSKNFSSYGRLIDKRISYRESLTEQTT